MPSFGISEGAAAVDIGATAAASAADAAAVSGLAAGSVASTAAATAGATSAASILSTVGTVGSVLSGVVGATSAITGARSQAAMAGYEKQVAANNATIATQNANLSTAAGASQVEEQGLKTRAEIGAITASQAASNVDVNSGSAVDVRSSAAALGQLDALTIRSNAEKTTYGYQTQALGFQGQEQLEGLEQEQAPIAGGISAAGSLLSGVSSASSKYAGWQLAAGGSPTATFFNS